MSELDDLLKEIKDNSKQRSINKIDENRVMRCMLNDPDFSIAVYDKKGYIGQRCPREEATGFVKNVIIGTTGLDSKNAKVLSDDYEFTKRDATFLLNNMKDFLNVYTSSGRKINVIQSEETEANLYTKRVNSRKKTVPKGNSGDKKEIETQSYIKLVSQSRKPKY